MWPMNAVHGTGAAFYPRCRGHASLKNDIFEPGGGDLGGGVIFFSPLLWEMIQFDAHIFSTASASDI